MAASIVIKYLMNFPVRFWQTSAVLANLSAKPNITIFFITMGFILY